MLSNKIYISGQNLSGKNHLMYLLNGSSEIAGFPYHKFGLSCELVNFKNYISKRKNRYPFEKRYFEVTKKTLKVKLNDKEEIYEINLSELIYFIIKNNGSIPYLLESHYTKKCPVFAGDSNYDFINFDFDFDTFIKSIEKNITLYNKDIYEIEDLDDIIFNSFLKSTNQYNLKLSQYKYYCQSTSNDINEVDFLLNNYKNIKLIYLTRDLVSSSYSVAKRILSKNNKSASKNNFIKLMFETMYNRKIQEDAFFKLVKKNDYENKLLIINFNELLNNSDKIMNDVCNFLKIKFEISMKAPHMISSKINNLSFQKNKMNDDPNELFTKKELNRILSIKNSKLKLFIYNYIYKLIFFTK